MRNLLLLMLFVTFPVCAGARTSGDEAAIRQVVQQYLTARENNDAKALAEIFTADADQLVSSGEWRRGRDELVRGTLGSSQSTGGNRTVTIETVRFVSPEVALADGRYELSNLAGGAKRSMWSCFVMLHVAEGWRIAGIRNMLPAAPVPAKAGR